MAVTATWGNAFYISALSVQRRLGVDGTYKERLHVGDGMRSVSVLELDASGELIDTARDFRPHWVLTMDELDAEGGGLAFSDVSVSCSPLEVPVLMIYVHRRTTTSSLSGSTALS